MCNAQGHGHNVSLALGRWRKRTDVPLLILRYFITEHGIGTVFIVGEKIPYLDS